MSKVADVPDPFQPEITYKIPYKNLMVKHTQKLLQERRLAVPTEDYDDTHKQQRERNIIPQMRDYRVERTNAKGQAVYSSDMEEHTLIAYMLAVYGCVVNCTDMMVPQGETPPAQFSPLKEPLPSAQKTRKKVSSETAEEAPIAIARNPNMTNPFQSGLGGMGLGTRTGGLTPKKRRLW